MGFQTDDQQNKFVVNGVDWVGLQYTLTNTILKGNLSFVGGQSWVQQSLDGDFGAAAAFQSANISNITENIAASMTQRLYRGTNTTLAMGEAFQMTTYVRVR
jgi:hypothetical protein